MGSMGGGEAKSIVGEDAPSLEGLTYLQANPPARAHHLRPRGHPWDAAGGTPPARPSRPP